MVLEIISWSFPMKVYLPTTLRDPVRIFIWVFFTDPYYEGEGNPISITYWHFFGRNGQLILSIVMHCFALIKFEGQVYVGSHINFWYLSNVHLTCKRSNFWSGPSAISFICVRSKCLRATVQMCRHVWALGAHQCNKVLVLIPYEPDAQEV